MYNLISLTSYIGQHEHIEVFAFYIFTYDASDLNYEYACVDTFLGLQYFCPILQLYCSSEIVPVSHCLGDALIGHHPGCNGLLVAWPTWLGQTPLYSYMHYSLFLG
jgi:hypothetical protein